MRPSFFPLISQTRLSFVCLAWIWSARQERINRFQSVLWFIKIWFVQRRHPASGDVYWPHIVNYQWESFNLLSIKTWHCQCMFININIDSNGMAVRQGCLSLLERIKVGIAERSANSQNCWNTKQTNKGHHNQDNILGQTNESNWQHPKQLWGWHTVCFISGEFHSKQLQLLDENSDKKDDCCACV